MKITGKKFAVNFGAKAVLEIQSETKLIFHITEIGDKKVDETETVEIIITQLRPRLFILTWKEKNGNTVADTGSQGTSGLHELDSPGWEVCTPQTRSDRSNKIRLAVLKAASENYSFGAYSFVFEAYPSRMSARIH